MNKNAFIFSLLTAFIWGLAPAFEKTGLNGRIDPFVGVVVRSIPIAAAAIMGLFVLGKASEAVTSDLKSVLLVATGGFLAGFLGQMTFYTALKSGEASVVVPLAATYPLIALLVSIIFLGEALTIQKVLGAGLIVGGVILLR